MATRHLVRSVVVQSLYEWDFYGRKKDLIKILERNLEDYAPGIDEPDFAWRLLKGVINNIDKIDVVIEKAAPEWPISRIPLVDRNVLRLGLYELLFSDKGEVPSKVAINEAVEVAKNFGGQGSGRFINGVLGTIFRQLPEGQKEEEEKFKESKGKKEEGEEEKNASDSKKEKE